MSYLLEAKDLIANGAKPPADEEDWTVQVDGQDYYINDGDTVTNVKTKQKIRLGGINAPETAKGVGHVDGQATRFKWGEVGGRHARKVLRDTFRNGNYREGDLKKQEYGGGADDRFVGGFVSKDDGATIQSKLFSEGLAQTTFETTQAQKDAIIAGELNRAMFGVSQADPFTKLRNETPVTQPIAKGIATSKSIFQDADQSFKTGDREWYATDFADQLFFGSEFDPRHTDKKGYAISPVSNGFKVGLHDTAASFGAFVSILGTVTEPVTGSDWLTEKGDDIAFVGQQKALNHPLAKVARFKDIDKYSDGIGETIYNGFKWLSTTAATSAPQIASIIGGAALAPVVLPTAGAATTLGASLVPSSILIAGSTWNGVDKYKKDENGQFIRGEDGKFLSNRNAGTAAITLSVAVAASAVERLGLAAIVSPSNLLTKIGFKKAAAALSRKNNISVKEASKSINDTLANEAKEASTYISKEMTRKAAASTALQTGLSNFISGVARLGTAGTIEGATEIIQEASSYLTAKGINEEIADADEFKAFLLENIEKNPELKELAIEAFAAGAGIGGSLNVAVSTWDASSALREKAWKSEANPLRELGTFREASHALRASIGKSISQVQDSLNERVNPTDELSGFETPSYEKGLYAKSLQRGRESNALNRIQKGDTTITGELYKGLTSLVLTPLGNLIGTEKINAAPSLFKIVSLAGGIRDALPGRNKDYQTNYLNGTIDGFFSSKNIGDRHGFSGTSESAQSAFSKQFYKFADLYIKRGRDLSKLTQEDKDILASVGIVATRKKSLGQVLNDFRQTYDDSIVAGDEIYLLTQNAYKRNLPSGDPRITKAEAYKQDWAILSREIDVEAINANQGKAVQDIITRLDTLQKIDPDNSDFANAFKDKSKYAKELVETMRTGQYKESPFVSEEDSKTTSTGKQRTSLHLADKNRFDDDVDFSEFYTNNIFSSLKVSRERAVREAVDLDYNGENNAKLDVLLSDAREELLAKGDMTPSQVDSYLGEIAVTLQNMDDARYGDFNRIPENLAVIQDNILTYTAILGLPLGMLASMAEVPGIAIALRGSAEFKKFMKTTIAEFGKALVRGAKNVKATRVIPGVASMNKRLETEFFDLQLTVGIPQENETLSTRVSGIENVDKALQSRFKRRLLDAFFTATLLKGFTGISRTVATSTALDFIRNRAAHLMHIEDFDNLKSPLTREQLDAYAGLGQIGIDVPNLIKGLQAKIGDSEQGLTNEISQIALDSPKTLYSERAVGSLEEEILTGIQSFVNTRVQSPNASNRPLIVQDPRFKMLTQFNAFLSSVTTTMVPKIWNDEVGRAIRSKNPTLSYEAFSVIVAMIALGGSSQWLKDHLKHGKSTPYIDSDLLYIQRMITSSGIFGQGEKLIEVFHPLYPTRGEGVVKRAASILTGAGGRQASALGDLFTPDESDDPGKRKEEFYKDVVKFIPPISSFTNKRNQLAEYLTNTF